MDDPDLQQRRNIAEAVRRYDIKQTEGWASLLQLSPQANVESVETFEDEIQLKGDTFAGAVLWHVTLQFGDQGGAIVTSESLPGRFEGHVIAGIPEIDRMVVDTSAVFQ